MLPARVSGSNGFRPTEHRRAIRVLAAFGLMLLLASGRTAQAEPRRTVQIFLAADPEERAALEPLLRELIAPLGVTLTFGRLRRVEAEHVAAPDAGAGHAAVVFIDAHESRRATLYLVDPRHDRVYVRSVPRPHGGEELAREELAHILETALEGLLGGETIGVPRSTAFPKSRPAPATPPAPAPPPGPELEFGLLYEAQYLSHEVLLTHGPVLAAGLGLERKRLRFGLWATAQYRQPLHAQTELLSARFEGGALRLLLTLDARLGERAFLRAGLGGGLDIVSVSPETRDPDRAEPEAARVLSFGVARAALGVGIELSAHFALLALVAADVDPSETRYVFSTRHGDEAVLTPATLRPAALFGLSFR